MQIPYDPDFDTAPNNTNGFFTNASPKLTFIFGLVLSLAVVSFIGFIILLI